MPSVIALCMHHVRLRGRKKEMMQQILVTGGDTRAANLRRCAVVHNLHVLARSQQLSAELQEAA